MRRATWKGTLQFGFVSLPVELYSTEQDAGIDLDILDKRDMAPVGYKKVNKTTGDDVPADAIVKGYQVEPGRYVLLDEEDFANANVKANQVLEVEGFVDATGINPLHFEKGYLIEPAEDASRTYAVFRDALAREGKVGVGMVVFHQRQHLGCVVPWGDALYFEILRFEHQLKPRADLTPHNLKSRAAPKAQEVELAAQLVASLSVDWRPSAYRDTYHDDLLALIRKKARTGKSEPANLPAPAEEAAEGKVLDLVELLRRSLAARGGSAGAKGAGRTASRASTGARRTRATGTGTPRRPSRAKTGKAGAGKASGAAAKPAKSGPKGTGRKK